MKLKTTPEHKKPNFTKQAKEFAATYATKLSDKQWHIFVAKLAEALEQSYELGLKNE